MAGSIFMLVLCGLTAYFFLVHNSFDFILLLFQSVQLAPFILVYGDGR